MEWAYQGSAVVMSFPFARKVGSDLKSVREQTLFNASGARFCRIQGKHSGAKRVGGTAVTPTLTWPLCGKGTE
jgi:hypothetical protein